jgi:hypothetical protein
VTRRGEADAILRRIWGYGRIFDDPDTDPTDTRLRMGALILAEIRDLHKLLQAGEFPPEEWDSALGFKYRERATLFPMEYVYPPGSTGSCVDRACSWIDFRAPITACVRCHTLRYRTVSG